MDGRTDGWMDGWMDRQTDRWTDFFKQLFSFGNRLHKIPIIADITLTCGE